jgi:cellulose synthase/poly-beta-1,6-N-acetylglucosamine synthase-like glycosyltransferase
MTILQDMLAATFWTGLAAIVYCYAAYPILIRIASRLFAPERARPQIPESDLPEVSLLICAHNEQDVIARRIENALLSDYPREKLEIVVASDGSSDQTCSIVRSFEPRGVRLIEFVDNKGKATALNNSIPQLRGSVIVLSDANTHYDIDAIRKLVAWLAAPSIVTVCGRLLLTDPATGKNADSMYWKYETFLKQSEGRLGALLGSNGAIYAMRRAQYVPIPAETRIDDFVIPLVARLKFGGKIIYDDQAAARELTPPDLGAEFSRRARIGGGGVQSLSVLWPLLNPLRGWVALVFFSHKILRWLCPLLMIWLLVANLLLLNHTLFRWLLVLQIAFYLSSLASALLPAQIGIFKPLRLAAMFAGMNAALFSGYVQWLFGRRGGTWKRTHRRAESHHHAGVV